MHHARCHLPAAIAHILAQDPQLVAPAVEAFYARDAAGMKAAVRMAHFPPQVTKQSKCLGLEPSWWASHASTRLLLSQVAAAPTNGSVQSLCMLGCPTSCKCHLFCSS